MAKNSDSSPGRRELLNWINGLLGLSYDRINELANGAAFCQVIDVIHPGSVDLSRVCFTAVTEGEITENYKILHDSLTTNGVTWEFDLPALLKGQYLTVRELCQRVYAYFRQSGSPSEYDGPGRRRGKARTSGVILKKPNPKSRPSPTGVLRNSVKNGQNLTGRQSGENPSTDQSPTGSFLTDTSEIKKLRKKVAELSTDAEDASIARDFYFTKARKIEDFCLDYEDDWRIREILEILYEPDEEHGFLPPGMELS
jgi:RP/EB family microtubule-associated protein